MHDIDPDLHQAVERNQAYDVTTQARRRTGRSTAGRSRTRSPDNNASWLPQQPYASSWSRRCRRRGGQPAARARPLRQRRRPTTTRSTRTATTSADRPGRAASCSTRAARSSSMEAFTRTVGAGQTYDLLFRWENVDSLNTGVQPGAGADPRATATSPSRTGRATTAAARTSGRRAALPRGVISYNGCGEYYFPMAQPRAERVPELRRGLRRAGDAAARRASGRLCMSAGSDAL